MEDRADGDGITKTLYHLVTDVSYFEVREYEDVGLAGDVAARSLLGTNGRNEGGICLQLTVDLQVGSSFLGETGGFNHLVAYFVSGTTLGREAQHGNARLLESCYALSCLSGADGNLRQLVGIGHRGNGNVTDNKNTVLTILFLLRDEQKTTRYTGDARSTLDNLKCGTQRVTSGGEGTRDLTVGTFGLDDHATQIERVLHQLTSLLNRHALLLAKLGEQLGIFFTLRIVLRVDDGSLVNAVQSPFSSQSFDLLRITDQDDVGDVFCQYAVGSTKCTLLSSFWEYNALLV